MALDSDHQKPVEVSSDQQATKAIPRVLPPNAAAGTPAASAESPRLDTARPLAPRRRGPRTAAGKARIGLNALKHGISSTRLVMPGETIDEWETHRRTIIEDLAPTGPVQTALAEYVADAIWRLRRVTRYETAAIAERQHLPTASARLLPSPFDIDRIIRYEAQLSRRLYKALHELESMQAARRGQPAPLLRVDIQGAAETLAAAKAATV